MKSTPASKVLDRVLVLEMVRVTEAAAIAASQLIGRGDEIIKSRGEKVAPKEVENVLMNIPGVKEAAVVGVPDELLGQAVKAFVVIEQGRIVGERQLRRLEAGD